MGSEEEARQSILYSYKHGFSGFASIITESQAKLFVLYLRVVVGVFPKKILQVQITICWDIGDGTIIGVIDSGVWPEQ